MRSLFFGLFVYIFDFFASLENVTKFYTRTCTQPMLFETDSVIAPEDQNMEWI